MSGPENGISPRIDRHIGRADQPWFPLEIIDRENFTYQVDKVRPLTLTELTSIPDGITEPRARTTMQGLIRRNRSIYAENSSIAVVLDARVGDKQEGWFGDMVEASRFIRSLRADHKNVLVITSHPTMMHSSYDRNITTIEIPPTIEGRPLNPWNPELLQFLGNEFAGIPFLFPLNAHMPLLINIDGDGNITNRDSLNTLLRSLRNRPDFGIKPEIWTRLGIHQLQALQSLMYMIGNEQVQKMKEFPHAFIFPDLQAKKLAQHIIDTYNCFPDRAAQGRAGRPLFLHPGVATDLNKLLAKSYPEEKWQEVIKGIASIDCISSMTFLSPIDSEQAAMTARLAKVADANGIPTVEVPLSEIEQKYNWTLGTFAAFLQHLSHEEGIILGVDSMPAGHLGPALGIRSVVLGNGHFNPAFFAPSQNAMIVMPENGLNTSEISPLHVVNAVSAICNQQ